MARHTGNSVVARRVAIGLWFVAAGVVVAIAATIYGHSNPVMPAKAYTPLTAMRSTQAPPMMAVPAPTTVITEPPIVVTPAPAPPPPTVVPHTVAPHTAAPRVVPAPAPAPAPVPHPAPAPAPVVSAGEANALRSAKEYLNVEHFSRTGLIEQLTSSYGEGFSEADATYAVNNVGADWNQQAAGSAKDYLNVESFSHSGLVKQLEFDGFTPGQAEYGVQQAGL